MEYTYGLKLLIIKNSVWERFQKNKFNLGLLNEFNRAVDGTHEKLMIVLIHSAESKIHNPTDNLHNYFSENNFL